MKSIGQLPDRMSPLELLISWFRDVNIELNNDLLRLEPMQPDLPGCNAYCVRATQDVQEGDRLGVIPKASCVSIRTSSIADLLQEERLAGGLGLIVAIMHEHSLGATSKWHGYLASLPKREYVPLFWQPDELQHLQGTEAHERALADRELTVQDYELHIKPLLSKYKDRIRRGELTQESFNAAASWVASRAFGIDDYHVDPICFGEGSSEENDSDDESQCISQDADDAAASANETAGLERQDTSDAEDCKQDAPESSSSDGDDENHDESLRPAAKRPRITRGELLGDDTALCLEIGICSAEINGQEVLEVIAASNVSAGREIHNTYGELGNADLLSKYGFSLPGNPFDTMQLDKQKLVEIAEEVTKGSLSTRMFCRRRLFLEEESDLLEEGEEPLEIMPGAKLGSCLYVALRVLCASESDFKGWRTITDALRRPNAEKTDSEDASKASIGENNDTSRTAALANGAAVNGIASNRAGPPDSQTCDQPDDEGHTEEDDEQEMIQVGSVSKHPWTAGMLQILHKAVTDRLHSYHHGSIDEDRAELATLPFNTRDEHHLALQAALLLAIGEKHILHQVLHQIHQVEQQQA